MKTRSSNVFTDRTPKCNRLAVKSMLYYHEEKNKIINREMKATGEVGGNLL